MPLDSPSLPSLFTVPLLDLGGVDPRYAGVMCPLPEIGQERVGITDQFLANAATYDALYANSAHFGRLFGEAMATLDGPLPAAPTVLDVGTGSGTNTIVPAMTLFPECRIVGTDLSPDLLAMLHGYVRRQGLEDRVLCVCTDAMADHFRPGAFDVVLGAAILHHLLDPTRALASAFRALRPGGIALFFEPFDGCAMVRMALELILERAPREAPLDPAVEQLLRAVSLDYATRAGTDKSAPHFRYMDDKWLFNRTWLTDAAREAGFASAWVLPHSAHATLYADFVGELLRLSGTVREGESVREALPGWAWEVLAALDRSVPPALKRELLLEGTLVLRKG